MQGLIHIYCGDGKGKTTAATGQCVRAAGSGMQVAVSRFLKHEDSGEVVIFRAIPEIHLIESPRSFGFYKNMSEEERAEAAEYYEIQLSETIRYVKAHPVKLLFLDEIMAAYRYELVRRETLLSFIKEKPYELEVLLTGRDPAEELLSLADYITEMKAIRHPFEKHIAARKGIEY